MSGQSISQGINSKILQTAINATSVSKSFTVDRDQIQILHDISLQVKYGEMVAIMGPSGSGKSTLMYCLAGLEQPSSGQTLLGGTNLQKQSRSQLAKLRRKEVGFVFQSYNLIPTLSTYDNVALPYLLSGETPPREKIEQVLKDVGLGHRLQSRPPSMSGGEQQRAALARVLAQEPQIIFADEPTGALDSKSGELVLSYLTEIAHTTDKAVLVVTHDPDVAARCDRVLFLKDGELVDELKPQSVKHVAEHLAELSAKSSRRND